VPVPPGGRAVNVSTSNELSAALADVRPGDVITMADGVYSTDGRESPIPIGGKRYYGTFVASGEGTADLPIVLQGTRRAVIDGKPGGDGTGTQYGLYLVGATHWQVRGITITNVSKGIVLDRSDHNHINGAAVTGTGQEGIHLRSFSSDNVVRGNVVSRTGVDNETYGEGIYVGSANSNWNTYTAGRADASDRNQLVGNHVSATGAESIDIKEGTSNGLIEGNYFDGTGMTGSWADSWVDLKGNRWIVRDNTGVDALEDGFQVHGALPGWGNGNLFVNNTAVVNGPGYGFWFQNNVQSTVSCMNSVRTARAGFANQPCA
jgi:parallel beta-helix repeat protein